MKNNLLKVFAIFGIIALAIGSFYFIGRHGDRSIFSLESAPPLPLVTQETKTLPPVPFLVDWCEGIACDNTISKGIVCDAVMYKEADVNSSVVGQLKTGEEVKGRTLFTKVLKLGSYQLGSHPIGTVVTFAGEGSWKTFQNGDWGLTDSDEEAEEHHEEKAIILEKPQTESWVLVGTRDGKSGFVRHFKTESGSCPFESPND